MYCPRCGKEIIEGQLFCGSCGAELIIDGVSEQAVNGRAKTAWEDRESLGILQGVVRTVRQVLFAPSRFFRTMPVTGGLSDPLVYALIVGMTGLAALYCWDILLHDHLKTYMTAEFRAASERSMFMNRGSFVAYFLTPFLFIMWLFIAAGALHVMLLLVRGARAGFEATFRVVCYSVSPALFLIIPACGMPITMLWAVILSTIGVKEAHDITGTKAVFAVLMPFVLFCCLLISIFMLILGAAASSCSALMQMHR